jgi:DNA-binding NarL/FixJ family response regulator
MRYLFAFGRLYICKMHRIAIVDDRPQNLSSLSEKIVFSGEVEIIFLARNGEDFLQQMKELPAEKRPQVVLMDIDMPVMNGIEAVRNARALYAETSFIMLTVFDDDEKLFEAIQAGAGGYLLKEETVETILAAIRDVMEKEGAPMSPRIARKALQLLTNAPMSPGVSTAGISVLSEREIGILRELVNGLDYRQIAEKLFISPHTVRKHIANIYEKLHVTSRAQAVRLATKNRWM